MGDDWTTWWRTHGGRELRCILMTAWDPVGAGAAPEAWNEYDSYAPGVARRLREAPDGVTARRAVADYLTHIERSRMGLERIDADASNAALAEALVAWHEWSFARGGRPPGEWL